jgi:hypothetical protein
MSTAAQIAERRAAIALTDAACTRAWRSKARGAQERGNAWWHANRLAERDARSYAAESIAEGCEMIFWCHPEFLRATQ